MTNKEYFAIISDDGKAKMILDGNIFTTKEISEETVVCFQDTATYDFFARKLKMGESAWWIFS